MAQIDPILAAYWLGRKDGLSKSKERKVEEIYAILGMKKTPRG